MFNKSGDLLWKYETYDSVYSVSINQEGDVAAGSADHYVYFFVSSPDMDGNGYSLSEDCNDHDPSVYPGAIEIYDRKDNNCDGQTDEVFLLGRKMSIENIMMIMGFLISSFFVLILLTLELRRKSKKGITPRSPPSAGSKSEPFQLLICPICKNKVQETWDLCPYCGARLRDNTRIYDDDTRIY